VATADELSSFIRSLLEGDGRGMSFFQAVRLMRRFTGAEIGVSEASGRPIRIRPALSLAFPESDILAIESSGEDDGIQMTVSFLGLYGVSSPLPLHYTERLIDLERQDQGAAREFIDVLHQPIYALLFSAWARCRPMMEAIEGQDKEVLARLFALAGIWEPQLQEDLPRDIPLLRYVGLLSLSVRPLLGLETMLRDFLGTAVTRLRVVQEWPSRVVPLAQRARLGGPRARLGGDLLLGGKGSSGTAHVSVLVEGVTAGMFLTLLWGESLHGKLSFLINLYLGGCFSWSIAVELSEAAPPLALGRGSWTRLGRDAWLGHLDVTARRHARIAGSASV